MKKGDPLLLILRYLYIDGYVPLPFFVVFMHVHSSTLIEAYQTTCEK